MKTLIVQTLILLIGIATTGKAQTILPLEAFDQVNVSGNITIDIVQSSESKADIQLLKGNMEALQTIVHNGSLDIHFAKSDEYSWGSGAKAKITLYTNSLRFIGASAGASVQSNETWSGKTLEIEASSGATVYTQINVQKASSEASSGARITISGASESLSTSCSSGASVDATNLASGSVSAECSSGGAIKVHSIHSLTAIANSGGSIKYKGEPKNLDIHKDKYSGGLVQSL